jgi:hypothetical protein
MIILYIQWMNITNARRMEHCEPYFVFIFWFLQIHSLIKLNYVNYVTISVFLF